MLHCGTSTLPVFSFIPAGPIFERVQWDIFEIYLRYIEIYFWGEINLLPWKSEEKDDLEADRQFVASSGDDCGGSDRVMVMALKTGYEGGN